MIEVQPRFSITIEWVEERNRFEGMIPEFGVTVSGATHSEALTWAYTAIMPVLAAEVAAKQADQSMT